MVIVLATPTEEHALALDKDAPTLVQLCFSGLILLYGFR